MDDFKRAIYIEARNQIARQKFGYMCNALEIGFDEVIGINWARFDDITDEEMEYFFSELFTQFDKKRWFKCFVSNERGWEYESRWQYEPNSHRAWMDELFVTERLALLDLLIDERL
jgi:hypothetical protein